MPARIRLSSQRRAVLAAFAIGLTASCTRVPDTGQAIARALEPAFVGHRSGGVVLVAQHGRPVFRRAYGMASVELGVAMTPGHVLGTGSITKQFTAAAILQLVARGAVTLDGDARTYVPELPPTSARITIDQLLTHTSGVPNVVDRSDFDAIARLDYTVDELLALTRDMPLHFEPGAGFHYSDSGYFLLGAVVERVSGLSYGDYIEQRLFRPIGMHDTWLVDGDTIVTRLATGYSVRDGLLVPPAPISMTVPYAAGGVFSTVDDLWRWDQAIRSGKVIDSTLLERAWQVRTLADGTVSGYGYGWKMCTLAGRRTIEHGGFLNGYQASLLLLPDEDVTVIVLVNNDADAPDAGATARRLGRLVAAGTADVESIALSPRDRQFLVGRYVTGSGDVREILDEGGTLIDVSHGVRRPLVALSPTRLAWVEGEESMVLTFDEPGREQAQTLRPSLRCEPRDIARRVS